MEDSPTPDDFKTLEFAIAIFDGKVLKVTLIFLYVIFSDFLHLLFYLLLYRNDTFAKTETFLAVEKSMCEAHLCLHAW